mmetsp:Transcript_11260/g.23934  ORF Transcript_11260/g.23934 Transcript_11260/m.23934 type:complete len:244 (-) Transcript_11260:214-945(-)
MGWCFLDNQSRPPWPKALWISLRDGGKRGGDLRAAAAVTAFISKIRSMAAVMPRSLSRGNPDVDAGRGGGASASVSRCFPACDLGRCRTERDTCIAAPVSRESRSTLFRFGLPVNPSRRSSCTSRERPAEVFGRLPPRIGTGWFLAAPDQCDSPLGENAVGLSTPGLSPNLSSAPATRDPATLVCGRMAMGLSLSMGFTDSLRWLLSLRLPSPLAGVLFSTASLHATTWSPENRGCSRDTVRV